MSGYKAIKVSPPTNATIFSPKAAKPLDEIKFLGRLLGVVMTIPEGIVAD
jgi:hypothetical protein